MKKLESVVKDFCKSNAGKESIDFSIFQNPEYLYSQLKKDKTLNQFKGDILEMLLEELFLGNGYRVERLGEGGKDGGCDLLTKYPEDDSIRFVLQAKNWNKNIDLYDVKKEYLKFSDNYRKKHNLNNSHFCFVSWTFVKDIKSQLTQELNIKVWDKQDITDKLFRNYKSRHPRKPSIVLEPYQEIAFNKILDFWKQKKRCYVEHCTGTGKTYIIAKLIQNLSCDRKNKMLVLSPSSYINDRILELLSRVVSSKTVGKTFKKDRKTYLLTYQYLLHNAGKYSLRDNFTHIIMDEVHRAGAPQWHTKGLLNVIGSDTMLVGLSATMERYSGGIDVKNFLDNNCSGQLSLFQAMARGILPIGEYVYSILDMRSKVQELKDEVKSKYFKAVKKKRSLLDRLDAREIKDYSIQEIIRKYYHSLNYRKIIAFCEDIEHTIDIGALLEKTFLRFSKIRSFKVHSKNTKSDNMKQFNNFSLTKPKKNEIYVLTAVDMLNEGIDVSGIDSVMLFRRTESPRIYFQQIGRAIRKHGAERPLIFDCVLNYQNINIKFVEEAERELKSYRNALEKFSFEYIEVPKTIHVHDEVQIISRIIEYVEKRLNLYPTYGEAKQAVMKLGISAWSQYYKRHKEDLRLPSDPPVFYKSKGWTDWYDFLGKERPEYYETLDEAKQAVRRLGISTWNQYRERYKENPKLPGNPPVFYKEKGWTDWYDFLRKERPECYETFDEAKQAVRRLGISGPSQYKERYKEDPMLPAEPQNYYKGKGWTDWYDFLGKGKSEYYEALDEAKQAVRRLGIRSQGQYIERFKEDPKLPSNPHRYYNKGWTDWYDFLRKERLEYYESLDEAKQAVKRLGISGSEQYRKRYKEDPRLPNDPPNYYKGRGWTNRYDFFGKERPEYYETLDEAKQAVRRLEISGSEQYKKRYREDPKLPSNPNAYYNKKGWIDWYDFFGQQRPYETLDEAKQAVKRLGISGSEQYRKRYKEDPRLKSRPYDFYKDKGWIDWYDFLGKKK